MQLNTILPYAFKGLSSLKSRVTYTLGFIVMALLLFQCTPEGLGFDEAITLETEVRANTCDTDIPNDFEIVYETSFENASIRNAHTLKLDIPHWFEYAASHQSDGGKGNGLGGARMWVDKNQANTGSKSIGLELFDIEKSRRAEFVIFPENIVGKEYYVSYWLYIPEDWGLYEPNINWDWFEIGNPFTTQGRPYSGIYISNPDKRQKKYTVSLGGRHENGQQYSGGDVRMEIPKGKWFHVYYYVKRDKRNGAVKLWFDGQLIGEKTGFPTMHSGKSNFAINVAKIYHERGDKTPKKIWIDDLVLYTKK